MKSIMFFLSVTAGKSQKELLLFPAVTERKAVRKTNVHIVVVSFLL